MKYKGKIIKHQIRIGTTNMIVDLVKAPVNIKNKSSGTCLPLVLLERSCLILTYRFL